MVTIEVSQLLGGYFSPPLRVVRQPCLLFV